MAVHGVQGDLATPLALGLEKFFRGHAMARTENDMTAIRGAIQTQQGVQRSALQAKLEIVGRAATSQKPQNKPARSREA